MLNVHKQNLPLESHEGTYIAWNLHQRRQARFTHGTKGTGANAVSVHGHETVAYHYRLEKLDLIE